MAVSSHSGSPASVVEQILAETLPAQLQKNIARLSPSQQILLLIGLFILAIPLITTPANTWQNQAIIGGTIFFVATRIGHIPQMRGVLLLMSLLTTSRYLYYRIFNTLNFAGILDSIATILLFGAELYAILVLFIGYFQTIAPTNRKPAPLPPEDQLPHVDIYIPTYNEDVEIVRKTALGAKHIDYPKKTVYILDDGRPGRRNPPRQADKLRRLNMWRMAEEIGVKMLTRKDNSHAKAGNINTALRKTSGDLILILDCDHIPTRDILKNVVGFFTDEKVALVQTPHWFYNPDPFERNLMSIGKVP
ncbi:MAG: glycosyltransferase, partial [Thermostichales cyanobacterium DRC_bins_46]